MSRNARINALLLLVVAALAVLPVALGMGDDKEEPFTGADAQAETAITENKPDYEPWFSPLYEPPSAEIESALFALQAAIGAGVVAFYFGLRKGRRQGEARAAEASLAEARAETVTATAGAASPGAAAATGAGEAEATVPGSAEPGAGSAEPAPGSATPAAGEQRETARP
ncbi:energy-coupling factor ABC transporter substrate-binding protein [Streptomyces sp. SAJ15]|uniref:energy-coupling factor ABC transporter substrate-binding protein n=1 Tax=Streptomyces sp. SAJ15 TaxID=2011095 RepID=UPI00118496BF|nr:energy-coupling factor ABC transporter substrate-binding protein [Streptomyces sp. SAJ15]TVL89701.1 cobalt ABC transporter substrate-binding protein CbiN [Streptomyces sp. SAJ15]